jgi:hypothetical protein
MDLNEICNNFGALITWAATYHVAINNVLNRSSLYFSICLENIQRTLKSETVKDTKIL